MTGMSEPKFEDWPFERLNFDDFPTFWEIFFLKNGPKFQNFGQNFTFLYPLQILNSFLVKIVPLWETFELWKRYPYLSHIPVTYFCLSGPPEPSTPKTSTVTFHLLFRYILPSFIIWRNFSITDRLVYLWKYQHEKSPKKLLVNLEFETIKD